MYSSSTAAKTQPANPIQPQTAQMPPFAAMKTNQKTIKFSTNFFTLLKFQK